MIEYNFSEQTAIFADIQSLPVFAHSIRESLLPISMIITDENLQKESKILVLQKPTYTRLDLFKFLNISVKIINNTEKLCFKKMIVGAPKYDFEQNATILNENTRRNLRELFKENLNVTSSEIQKSKTQLLLLNRPSKSHRSILNHEKLLKEITANFPNWEVSYSDFARMSTADSIRLVMKIDILVSIHGSGMSNLLFLKDNSTIIEIFPYLFGHFYHPYAKIANRTKMNLIEFHASRNSSFPKNEKLREDIEKNNGLFRIFKVRQNLRDQNVILNDTEISSIISILKSIKTS